jgi:hypothetical protein
MVEDWIAHVGLHAGAMEVISRMPNTVTFMPFGRFGYGSPGCSGIGGASAVEAAGFCDSYNWTAGTAIRVTAITIMASDKNRISFIIHTSIVLTIAYQEVRSQIRS